MLVVLDDAGGQETAHGLDPKTGARRWSTPLGENYVDEFEPGPRCTPVIFEDRLYAQTARGEFRCLRLADGHTLWRTNFKDLGMVWNPERNTGIGAANRRGNTGSPLVSKDRVLVQVGSTNGASIVAFEPRTGRLLWKSQDDLTAYTSPVLAEVAGRPQFITATCNGLLALAPEDGRVLWRVPFRSLANRHVLTPIVLGDTVYFASHSTGLRAVRVRRDGEGFQTDEVWLNPKLRLNLSTPVAVGGHLYGLGAAKDYVSINTRDGSVDWSQPGFGDVAATLASGSRLLVLTDLGELLLLAANPERYEELGRVQVTGKTYVHPAYADGVLYVRDPRELQAIRLTPQ
jgi:outer membrane protein assembly factor BamB